MRWNPYIELRCEASPSGRASCKECGVAIDKGTWRAAAIDVLGREELFHLDCGAKRAPDIARRKVLDADPEWPEEARRDLARFVPDDAEPAPRSFQRTPILDLSYAKETGADQPCVYCGNACPGDGGPGVAHAVRAFSLDGERRFHPACLVELAPGLCRRVAVEESDRWPGDLRAFFAERIPDTVPPTPRSPWRNTGGVPRLHRSPSGRAGCRFCNEKIQKGELRIGREQVFGMRKSPVYFHVGCYAESDDFHPRMLELLVVKADEEVTRDDVAELTEALPPDPPEDDDVPSLQERLLALADAIAAQRAEAAEARAAEEAKRPQLTRNVVEIPEGFFGS